MLPRMLAMLDNDGSYCVTVVCTAQALVGALVGWWTDFGGVRKSTIQTDTATITPLDTAS